MIKPKKENIKKNNILIFKKKQCQKILKESRKVGRITEKYIHETRKREKKIIVNSTRLKLHNPIKKSESIKLEYPKKVQSIILKLTVLKVAKNERYTILQQWITGKTLKKTHRGKIETQRIVILSLYFKQFSEILSSSIIECYYNTILKKTKPF